MIASRVIAVIAIVLLAVLLGATVHPLLFLLLGLIVIVLLV